MTAPDRGPYAVGYAPLDRWHEELESSVDAWLAAAPERRLAALTRLQEHLARHFADEDAWLTDDAGPMAAAHRQQHRMMLDVVAELLRRRISGDDDLMLRLMHELPVWLAQHATTMDAELARLMRDRDGADNGSYPAW